MSLQRFFQIIDKTVIGKLIAKKTEIFNQLDPDRIYVENIRSFYGIPYSAAKFFCEMAVKEGAFGKKYAVQCPNCGRLIKTYETKQEIPKEIDCINCQLNEELSSNFTVKKTSIISYYYLKPKYQVLATHGRK